MKKYILLFIVTIFSVTLWGQDKKISEKLSNITKIYVDGDLTVNLIKAKENKIEGLVPRNQIENFSWNVIDSSTLVITLKRPLNLGNNLPLSPITLTFYYSELNDIRCKRSGRIITDEIIETKVLSIDISRNSVVSIPVKCFDLTAHCSFGSILTVSGYSEFVVVNCSYGADVKNAQLVTENTTVNATTDAKAEVQANKKLLLSAKTNAIVKYKKSDAVVSKTETLLGKVEEQNDNSAEEK